MFECVFDIRHGRPPTLTRFDRALEGIKVQLRSISERAGTTEQAEKEGDLTATCDLADDLRDIMVEYQVSTDT